MCDFKIYIYLFTGYFGFIYRFIYIKFRNQFYEHEISAQDPRDTFS